MVSYSCNWNTFYSVTESVALTNISCKTITLVNFNNCVKLQLNENYFLTSFILNNKKVSEWKIKTELNLLPYLAGHWKTYLVFSLTKSLTPSSSVIYHVFSNSLFSMYLAPPVKGWSTQRPPLLVEILFPSKASFRILAPFLNTPCPS